MTAAALRPTIGLAAELDRVLAAHPDFGDGYAIERRSIDRLRSGLLRLSSRVPAVTAAALEIAHDDHALLALLADPVLRNAFESDLECLATGRPDRATALAAFLPTVDLSAYGPCQRLAEPARSAWPAYGGAWVWTAIEESTGPVAARLWRLLREAFPGIAPVRPLDHDLAALRRGAALLAETLPGIGGAALHHVRTVVLARVDDSTAAAEQDGPLCAMSGDDGLPGALLIAPARLHSRRSTARLLLREGARLALLEIDRCQPLLATGPAAGSSGPATAPAGPGAPAAPAGPVAPAAWTRDAPAVPAPWCAEAWSTGQALAALHGYAHLALFRAATRATQAAHGTRGPRTSHSDTALARAEYLADQLERQHAHRLSPHGLALVRWLGAAVARLHRW